MSDELKNRLFVSAADKYGDKYIEHLLEQYRIYVESAEKISDRRQKTNEFFLGLNTALVGLLGFLSTRPSGEGAEMEAAFGVASLAGVIICFFWYRIIRSYKGLNSAKYEVIHLIEGRLPLALYDTEWDILERGTNKKTYWPFSHIELMIPWIFICLYVVLIGRVLFQ